MNFQEKLKQIRELVGLDENVKSLLEKMTGKELVSYEGIDALVAALMTFYNGELKKKVSVTEFDEKFKNFCPFPVNSLYISLGNENPSSLWLGTTWQKQENRFLLGAGSSFNLGSNGGNSTVTLSIDNLPSHNHTASTANHSHTQQEHTHTLTSTGSDYYTYYGANYIYTTRNVASYKNGMINAINSAGGDTTGSASPTTSIGYTGSDSAFSIMPPYLAVNIWKRTS